MTLPLSDADSGVETPPGKRDIPVDLLGWGEIRPLLEEETIRALEQGLGGR
jgi:hypothetical protein